MTTTLRTKWRRAASVSALVVVAPLVLGGCRGVQSSLNPHSHAATDIANLFWWMMAVAFGGLLLVTAIIVAAWFRRRSADDEHAGEHLGNTVVVALGIVMPICVVSALFIVSNTLIINVTQAPAASSTAMTVQAIGHEWWWEFRYPGTRAVTADELHIPVRTRVNLVATTADVIHSFWVPPLNRKIDTIPGQRNRILLYSNTVGTFRGQCAEFCGIQHAHMAMLVIVQTESAFRAWLRNQAADARRSTSAGETVFLTSCSSCHAIRGTSASGNVGPDLTHVGSRAWLAGLTFRNTPAALADWITGSQRIKPGNQMPDIGLTGARLRDLVSYLESLK